MWELGMWVHLTSVIYCLWINLAHLCYPHCLFLCFEAVLVLRIHLAKSELVLVGEVSNFDELASILCHIVSSLPMKYLDEEFKFHKFHLVSLSKICSPVFLKGG